VARDHNNMNQVFYLNFRIPGSETAGRQAGCAGVWFRLLSPHGNRVAKDLNTWTMSLLKFQVVRQLAGGLGGLACGPVFCALVGSWRREIRTT
jgi:hypothetical protein